MELSIAGILLMLPQRIINYIADLLPLNCELCGLELDEQHNGFCFVCRDRFLPTPRCQCCGLPCVAETLLCGECLVTPPPWRRLYCVGDYQQPLSTYVHHLKYEGQFWYSSKLVDLLIPNIDAPAEVVTSVPLHWRRQWRRGFNQSELLAASLAKQLGCEYRPLFRRTRATKQQKGLSRSERQVNLNGAFRLLKEENSYRHVAIVDDVVTTGSTVQHLCKLLLDSGVKSVDIYCICRTPDVVT